ncbi:Na+/H+ antiporter subunit A [Nigerium massiliense]|uniref:Na+/H+ antiporter subunit A n=1 Tax=Nigerium massiliense TaxID=1522317 RepID=UPI00058CD551|nr:Na+/H+ antiporter subunit A [Nigerium massiliense]
MLLTLIGLHLALAVVSPLVSRVLGRNAFFVMALLPAASFVWAVVQAPAILGGGAYRESLPWIPQLGVSLTMRVGLVQWVLTLIVTGIGALILIYCRWYFEKGSTRCLGLLTAFAGAMLGLVTTDDLIVLYVFWELTTVFSYLLIGYDSSRRANRSAALTALIVTTTGGLAMLVGIVSLGFQAGTFSIEGVLASPPVGTAATVAALLMLVGAISKSALAPFHFWLPGAMAAPTPVSAYLHAAAMVKAGIYLVAVLAPTFSTVPLWRPAVTILGATTMILGGWRSLRQTDLKLLLAYGTVSQLGFITLLTGLGTQAAALAGLAMTITHALFKSSLFLTVGVIDHSTGTRDLRQLSGLGRQLPGLATTAALAAASMAGVPPLLGFISKEAALESVVYLATTGDGTGILPAPAVLVVLALVLGSAFTMAYSLRFWWGAFAVKPGSPASELHHAPAPGFMSAPMVLGALCLVGGFLGPQLTAVLKPYADAVPTGEPGHGLALWHGITAPLLLSVVALTAGLVMFWKRSSIGRIQATFPKVKGADEFYKSTMRSIDWLAVEITARVQRGSLASYLSTALSVLVIAVGGTLLLTTQWPQVRLYDTIAQPLVGIVMIAAAIALISSRGRVRAVLTLGITGYGTALLFFLHGAPDLALTQVLVESVTLLVFLLVLRSLPKYFTNRPLQSSRWWRMLLAVAVGATITGVTLVSAGARTATPISAGLETAAYEFGYGTNIVNVILVDTRAWDTLGEISVLIIAATGVASLIFLRTRRHRVRREAAVSAGASPTNQPGTWLRGSQWLNAASRSLIFEVVTRLLFGVMMVISVYVLIAGHNLPGGGFAGGLIAGLALFIRYLAAGTKELDDAAPVDAGLVLGIGFAVAGLSALLPAAFGGRIFQSFDITLHVPWLEAVATPWGPVNLLGDIHLVSSTIFDVGVYLVVVGVLLDLVRSLGSGIDTHEAEHIAPLPRPESTRAIAASARRRRR